MNEILITGEIFACHVKCMDYSVSGIQICLSTNALHIIPSVVIYCHCCISHNNNVELHHNNKAITTMSSCTTFFFLLLSGISSKVAVASITQLIQGVFVCPTFY